jgi:D-3-phosphoglycerate dehydrogenase
MQEHKYQVVITDCDHGSIEEEKEEFDRVGAELILVQLREEEEVIRTCEKADGLLTQYAPMTRKVLERLPKCKVVARYGVGVDSIDLNAATDLGILVCNVPDYCIDEVADQALAMILSLVRKTAFFDRRVRSGHWDFREGKPIHRMRGKTLGLVGSGKIGLEVAKRVSAFGVKVIAFDPYIKEISEGITLVDLHTLLKESDFISVHCPLNESTRHLIGEKEFERMEKKPLLLNTSRGPVVDEKALVQALERGQISGAGLDVLEWEPPNPKHPLLAMDNVILSPHVGFYSEESIRELKKRSAKNVSAVLEGRWPESVVNRDVMKKPRARIGNPE